MEIDEIKNYCNIDFNEIEGEEMFENMPSLKPGQVVNLHLFPLEKADQIPDIIIVEDNPEKLMWISLAYLHAVGGERVTSSTAILQATCVDSTIIPFLEQRLNLGYGCYGCRDATDLGENEAVIGFPGSMLPKIMEHLEFLGKKPFQFLDPKKRTLYWKRRARKKDNLCNITQWRNFYETTYEESCRNLE